MSGHRIRTKAAYFAGRYRWIALFTVMALGVFLYSRIPAAYADSPVQQAQLRTQFRNLVKGFGKTNYSYMREAYTGLKQFTQAGGKYGFITGAIRNISAGLGTAFVIVYFLFSIVRETQKGDTSSEMWLRTCAAAFAALFMISWISPAMDALYGIGDYIVTAVEAAVETDAVVGDVIDTATQEEREDVEKKMAEAGVCRLPPHAAERIPDRDGRFRAQDHTGLCTHSGGDHCRGGREVTRGQVP